MVRLMRRWLETEESLSDWKDKIATEFEFTDRAVQDIVRTPRIDALIAHRGSQWIIPEPELCGLAHYDKIAKWIGWRP